MRTKGKKLLAVLLTLAMTAGGIQLTAHKATAEETEIILISNAEDLGKIGVDENYPMDGNYKLTEDISDVCASIGNSSSSFTGEFDGDGHTVTLDITTEENYKGLFGNISDAVVKNVVVRGSIQTQYGWAAGITAKAVNSTITNCGSDVDIHSNGSNSTCFAGIAGYAQNTVISNCYNAGNIDGKIKNAAGIVGQSQTAVVIKNCYNSGEITTTATSTPRVGGIVGYGNIASGNEGVVSNCYNAGSITGTSQTGTFMGYIHANYSVTNCYYLEGTHENVVGFNYQANLDDIKSVTEEELKNLADTLGEEYTVNNEYNSGFPILTWQINTDAEDLALLESLVDELPTGVIRPKFNTDKNIITYISNQIEEKEQYAGKGITVSVKSVENRMGDADTFIADDGTIHYYYRNLFEENPYRYFGQTDVVFEISLNNVSVEYRPQCVNIYWDLEKVQNDLQTVAEEYDSDAILGENLSLNEVTQNLSLPKYPLIYHNGENKNIKWVSVHYTSSNSDVIRISDTAEWDDNYDNMYYNAQVMRKETEEQVTITAEFIFERYTINSQEDTITESIRREIPVTVSAGNEEEDARKALQEKLAEYADNLLDFTNGKTLDLNNVKSDIQLVVPSKLGLSGKEYDINVDSSDTSVVEINAYRTYTYRPLPGQEAKDVTLTVTITNKSNPNISAACQVRLTVIPLTKQEITEALNFMEAAKAQFFEFIRNNNTDPDNITSDLKTFYGIYQDSDGNIYAASYVDKPDNSGILAEIVNPQEPVPDNIRYWISSNPQVVDDQSMRVILPKYDTKVRVGAVLSNEVYKNYAKRYADDKVYGEIFGKLVNQEVCIDILVKGTEGESSATEDFTKVVPGSTTTPTSTSGVVQGEKSTTNSKNNYIQIKKLLKVKRVKIIKRKKGLKVQWKRNKKADGYQIKYSTNRKFKKANQLFVKSGKRKSKTLQKLKSKRNYFVKVRAYQWINKKRVYGKWSKIKKAKTK